MRTPLAESLALVLAENIASDIDSPPHDKSLVDGYAVIAADLASGSAEFEVIETITAGQVPTQPLSPGRATQIMTGAPIPDRADAVVMVEDSQEGEHGKVVIHREARRGQHIMRRGASIERGDVVLSAGVVIRAIEIGLLAEVGREQVEAISRPRVAVVATGDELTPLGETPSPGCIRNSNGPMLTAAVRSAGAEDIDLGIGRDRREDLTRAITQGLQSDVVLLSGGVSAGVADLVPSVLVDLGVEQLFHKVRLKPGKPLWFGVRRGEPTDTLVFGLPGNPVSSLVCFELFVRPALASMSGRAPGDATFRAAELASEFVHRGDRPTYHPTRLSVVDDRLIATPLTWRGSADLATMAAADALIRFAPGERTYQEGEEVEVMPLG